MDSIVNIDNHKKQIVNALARSGHKHTYEEVKQAVINKEAQYWPANNSAAITEIANKSDGTVGLNVWLYGGNLKDFYLLVDAAKVYVNDLGGSYIETFGHRKGWNRLLKKLGFVVDGKTLIWRP